MPTDILETSCDSNPNQFTIHKYHHYTYQYEKFWLGLHDLLNYKKSWYFSDRASWIDYILITNLMLWLLFIHKILFSSKCFEPQVLIFRWIQLYTCSAWYCHSVREFLVACRCTVQAVYRQATRNSCTEWQYHMLHVYKCILLKMVTWGSKHVEENSILWINNNQYIKLVINI